MSRVSQIRKPNRAAKWLIACALVGALLITIMAGFEKRTELDINSGYLRTVNEIYHWQISSHSEGTWVSTMAGSKMSAPENAWWQPVNRTGYFQLRTSCCIYGYAIYEMNTVESLFRSIRISKAAKEHIAQALLRNWQLNDYCGHANRYVQSIEVFAYNHDHEHPGETIEVDDLPPG